MICIINEKDLFLLKKCDFTLCISQDTKRTFFDCPSSIIITIHIRWNFIEKVAWLALSFFLFSVESGVDKKNKQPGRLRKSSCTSFKLKCVFSASLFPIRTYKTNLMLWCKSRRSFRALEKYALFSSHPLRRAVGVFNQSTSFLIVLSNNGIWMTPPPSFPWHLILSS